MAGESECSVDALEVHHLVPVRAGGAALDPTNLLLVCKRHNVMLDKRFREARSDSSRISL
jgi:hypothetical protein